ncbi:hypothetical protein ARTSIC4J27_578 [Pseudarthrobacter siccitolerans]|uniref:Uncharacterized protein n=1 Tax=Pseudarthrobacter siccitolerans TaxID=861266 RepID=A0A024GYU2_9MICC|nr:hypothetical protein ARTSIC4J27_578 [Pseudarthrobacter siccitolerans]
MLASVDEGGSYGAKMGRFLAFGALLIVAKGIDRGDLYVIQGTHKYKRK